jgi:methylglutaconyl-CoA hydratase
MAKYSEKQNLKDSEELFDMYWAIRCCPVPVIAGVFGHCFGGGAGLTAVCDIVAAESSTQFSFSEVKLGLVPAVISPFVMERVHPAHLSEWFLTAKIFDAKEAKRGGLIHFAGSAKECDEYLETTFKNILNAAPEAVREAKKLIQSYSIINWKIQRGKVVKLIAERRVSAEGQRGLWAFLNKENPRWSDLQHGSQD